jgi:hypothetical protein
MNTIKKICTVGLFFFIALSLSATDYQIKRVSEIKEGAKLTSTDIAFFNLVTAGKPDSKQVAIAKNIYSEGQQLSKDDAKFINAAIARYAKNNASKTADDSKHNNAKGTCCWYQYCYATSCQFYWSCD